jgi:hypothetical protein
MAEVALVHQDDDGQQWSEAVGWFRGGPGHICFQGGHYIFVNDGGELVGLQRKGVLTWPSVEETHATYSLLQLGGCGLLRRW